MDAVEWALEGEMLGAGEILLTSMDTDGVQTGFDCKLTHAVSQTTHIPVIASGGAGKPEDFERVLTDGLCRCGAGGLHLSLRDLYGEGPQRLSASAQCAGKAGCRDYSVHRSDGRQSGAIGARAREGAGRRQVRSKCWTSFAAFPQIQVIDLDAAMSKGSNDALVELIASRAIARVGGGVRSPERARALIEQGAYRVIVGTAAFDREKLTEIADAVGPDRLVIALDSKGGKVVTHGWQEATNVTAEEMVRHLEPYLLRLPLHLCR